MALARIASQNKSKPGHQEGSNHPLEFVSPAEDMLASVAVFASPPTSARSSSYSRSLVTCRLKFRAQLVKGKFQATVRSAISTLPFVSGLNSTATRIERASEPGVDTAPSQDETAALSSETPGR
jgi:hypothetical protein